MASIPDFTNKYIDKLTQKFSKYDDFKTHRERELSEITQERRKELIHDIHVFWIDYIQQHGSFTFAEQSKISSNIQIMIGKMREEFAKQPNKLFLDVIFRDNEVYTHLTNPWLQEGE